MARTLRARSLPPGPEEGGRFPAPPPGPLGGLPGIGGRMIDPEGTTGRVPPIEGPSPIEGRGIGRCHGESGVVTKNLRLKIRCQTCRDLRPR